MIRPMGAFLYVSFGQRSRSGPFLFLSLSLRRWVLPSRETLRRRRRRKRRVMLCARALYIILTTWYRNSTFLKCCKKPSLKLSSPPSLLCQCSAEAIWDAAGTHGAPEKMFLFLNLDHMTHPPFSSSFSKLVCCFWNCAAAALEKTSGTHPNLSLLLLLFLFLFCVSRTASFASSSSSSWNP